jgi:hypothetical protein
MYDCLNPLLGATQTQALVLALMSLPPVKLTSSQRQTFADGQLPSVLAACAAEEVAIVPPTAKASADALNMTFRHRFTELLFPGQYHCVTQLLELRSLTRVPRGPVDVVP